VVRGTGGSGPGSMHIQKGKRHSGRSAMMPTANKMLTKGILEREKIR